MQRAMLWVGVASAGLWAGIARAQEGPPPALVVFDPVKTQTVEKWREVTGELRAVRRTVLAAEEEGSVIELKVEAGDSVPAGAVIARLDDVLAGLEVEQARALMESRRATVAARQTLVDKALRDVERRTTAFSMNSGTEIEVLDAKTVSDQAAALLSVAQADLTEAEAKHRWAQKKLNEMVVRAPFAGTVAAKRTEVGQWLTRGAPVVEIVALDEVDAWLDVPESVAMTLGARVRAAVAGAGPGHAAPTAGVRMAALGPGAAVRSAPIAAVLPMGDPLSRLFPVRVRLDNKDGSLRPGMSVAGVVPAGETEPGLTIHKDAVRRGDSGTFVFFDASGVAAIAPVSVVSSVGDRLVVQSPLLRAGMNVVVEGNERLMPGQPVKARQ